MAQPESRALRAALAIPFLGLAILCLGAMDINKLVAHGQTFLDAGSIDWDGGTMQIFDQFYKIPFIDDMWRGITVTFSASYVPLDAVGWWQLFSFLNDLGPVYSVWFLESCRAGNAWTPAYTVTVFTFIAQLLGVGNVAPIYYFLHVTFAPSAAALKRSAKDRQLRSEQASYLLPLFLGLHTFEVVRIFTAVEPETRQYWVWAWQMSPLWIGVTNSLLGTINTAVPGLKHSVLSSPSSLLAVMSASIDWIKHVGRFANIAFGTTRPYVVGKLVEMRDTEEFAKTRGPHFTVSHVVPGYVFGRNELALDAGMMQTQNSSNNFLMVGLLGGELPFPIHGGFAHIDNVAEIHLRVALEEAYAGKDVDIATKVDCASIFDHIKDKFPEAVKEGIFNKGTVPTIPMEYDSSDAKGLLGELKSFETAVSDVAAQYLELLGKGN